MLPALSSLYDFRCEAINKANEQNPAVSRIGYRVFFPPQSLAIVVDRPDKGSGYDRTIDFELAVGVASSSTRNRNRQDDVRIVVAGELVTLRCEAGNCRGIVRIFNQILTLRPKLDLKQHFLVAFSHFSLNRLKKKCMFSN